MIITHILTAFVVPLLIVFSLMYFAKYVQKKILKNRKDKIKDNSYFQHKPPTE